MKIFGAEYPYNAAIAIDHHTRGRQKRRSQMKDMFIYE